MQMKTYFCYILMVLLLPFTALADNTQPACAELEHQLFLASEMLRMDTPEIRIDGVNMLFEIGGLYAYMTLQYLWIAEPHTEGRQAILKGFKHIGDHAYIADPNFPQYWLQSLVQFHEQEQQLRLKELKQFFPKLVTAPLKPRPTP